MSKTINKIDWGDAHYLWSDFRLGDDYTQYLLDEYGVIVEAGGRVIWDKVFTIEVVVMLLCEEDGGIPEEEQKKEKRKIKLIFICGDIDGVIEKEVNDNISTQLLSDIRNKIEESLKTQIVLSDVQIIKG